MKILKENFKKGKVKMKLLFIIIFFPLIIYPQELPTYKDFKIYKGNYSIIKFEHDTDISADSVSFNLRANRDDTTYTLQKYNDVAGGDSTQIDIDDNMIIVKLTTANTSSLSPATYNYFLADDSTIIYVGYLKVLSIGY